jgi:hypothetical protein
LYKSEIPYSSESETLFVFTVITRSQNIGRPLLKRFPSCAILCLCTITTATFTVSVRHTLGIFSLWVLKHLCVYTLYPLTCICIIHTHLYIKFHPYPTTSTLWNDDFFRELPLARLYDIIYILYLLICLHENVYQPDDDTSRVVTIIKRLFEYSYLFNMFYTQRSLLFP